MKTWRRAIGYFRDDGWLIAALIVCIAISYALELLKPWSISMLFDLVVTPKNYTDTMHRTFLAVLPASATGRIIGLAILATAVLLGQHTTWFIGRIMLNKRIRYNGLARVRLALYHKFQHLALDYHRARPLGDTIYRLSTDTQGFFNILDTLIGASVACATVIVQVIVMSRVSMELTLLSLCVVPPLVAANLYFARAIQWRALRAKQADSDFTSTVQQSMGAIGLIQLFWRQRSDFLRFERAVLRANDMNWRLNWFDESLYPLAMQVIFALGTLLIFGAGGMIAYRDQFVLHRTEGVTFGDLLVFMQYVAMLNDPLGRITGFKAAIQTNVAAADRVFAVLDMPVTVMDHPEAVDLPLQSRTLTLEDVSFAYPGAEAYAMADSVVVEGENAAKTLRAPGQILSNIHATIQPGQFAAFVGASGAGKTTLFSLLPRFYDATSGAIRLDGHDVRKISLADLRKHIAMVQQDSPLFPGTIAENIAFARPDATRQEIIAAAKDSGADAFITQLDRGYDTVISENAANLSGGQRQRLALARAILTEAPILLLDEPTSAQDPMHAAGIMATLDKLRGRRTILLVTHDLSLAEKADHVFVLQAGKLVEAGSPETLMASRGVYWRMRTGAAGE